ncbi:hypothetical protein ACEI25_001085 [Photobacterium damselae]
MNKIYLGLIAVGTLFLVGCSGHGALSYNDQPVVMNLDDNYELALSECKIFADQATGNKEAGRKTGVVLGLGMGALAGGLSDEGVIKGAALGGTSGFIAGDLAGRSKDLDDAQYVLRKCLENKGYTVLDKRDS